MAVMELRNEQEYVIDIDLYLANELGLENDVVIDVLLVAAFALPAPFVAQVLIPAEVILEITVGEYLHPGKFIEG